MTEREGKRREVESEREKRRDIKGER